jgi:hypothetical protein
MHFVLHILTAFEPAGFRPQAPKLCAIVQGAEWIEMDRVCTPRETFELLRCLPAGDWEAQLDKTAHCRVGRAMPHLA